MSDQDSLPPDQVPGAPHPRDTETVFGQAEAEAAFLTAFCAQRLHHGWLLTGPEGIGKATLAYRLARFLLTTPPLTDDGLFGAPEPPKTLDIAPDHPVQARIRAGSEPGLRVITRSVNEKTNRLRDMIVVDDIRRLAEFFQLSAADGGHRVVIVDSADDMNVSAANALLKILEEPPADTTLFLIAHQPSRLLPTIRSRCRTLRLSPLPPDLMAQALHQAGAEIGSQESGLAELSAGSVGAALRLDNAGGLEMYDTLVSLMADMPNMDRAKAQKLAESCAQRGAEARLDLMIDLLGIALARIARTGATGHAPPPATPQESQTFARLAPTPHTARLWATRATEITARLQHGRAVNLDPAALVLDTLIKLNDTARDTTQPSAA